MSRDLFTNQLLTLAHVIENQIKGKYCWKTSMLWRETRNKGSCNDNKWFLYIWLRTFRGTNCWSIIARLHGLIKIKGDIHLWARFIGLVYGSLQCMKYGYHSWLQRKTKKWRYENGLWNSIVGVQSLTQYGKGKWWRNQPRWLVRGTKQALVEWRLTMCAIC